jgi:Fe2+ transport system protein FeoA
VNLWNAPFRKPLRVLSLSGFESEVQQVLLQLGLDSGETIEKIHAAPLRDPVSLKIGEHVFSLRSEVCRGIEVEELPGKPPVEKTGTV